MTNIAIAGAAGRMGLALINAAPAHGFVVSGASEHAASPALGRRVGAAAITADVAAAAREAQAWIDFTTPAATRAALAALPAGVRAVIIGTTGFSAEDDAAIAAAAQSMAIVKAGNFSLGVALMCALVKQAAAKLSARDWDIEIVEAHHKRKVDAPSGTALMIARAAAAGRGVELQAAAIPPREGQTGARPEGGIGMAVVRGGGIVGEHSAIFAAEREVLTLHHSALDRAVFADGALHAARWALTQPPGLYSIEDVLGV